jgi:hypothetical protein
VRQESVQGALLWSSMPRRIYTTTIPWHSRQFLRLEGGKSRRTRARSTTSCSRAQNLCPIAPASCNTPIVQAAGFSAARAAAAGRPSGLALLSGLCGRPCTLCQVNVHLRTTSAGQGLPCHHITVKQHRIRCLAAQARPWERALFKKCSAGRLHGGYLHGCAPSCMSTR